MGKEWVKRGGATCGCAIKKCNKSFHYYCAKTSPSVLTKRIQIESDGNRKVVLYR